MITKFKFLFSMIALILCLTAAAFGQERTGNLEGTVKDPQGNVVTGVPVTISSGVGRTDVARPDATTGFNRTAVTDESGFFRILQVPPGFYNITTGATSGFGSTITESVEVVLGKTTPVNIALQAGNVQETVTVVSDAIAIDPTDNKIQTNITAQVAELLPKGTNFTSLLQIAPAVRNEPLSGGFQIDGASGSENTFIIDGQEVTNFRTGTLNANNNVPFQFVQEVQIKSSGFEAEFGGATGGVVNVVTKGGNNEFHGEFGLSLRPAELQAGNRRFLTNAFADGARLVTPRRDGGTSYFPTANLSGPVIKDRAWFFLSYTPQFRKTVRQLDFINTTTGAINASERFVQNRTDHFAFTRIDANVFDNLRFSGTYTWNPIDVEGTLPGLGDGLGGTVPSVDFGAPIGIRRGANLLNQQGGRQNSQNVTGQLTFTPTSKLVVTARGGYSYLNEKIGNYGIPSVVGSQRIFISGLSIASRIPAEAGGVRGSQNRPFSEQLLFDASRRRTFDIDASYLANIGGRHLFKGGYQRNALSNDVFTTFIDQISLRYGLTINQSSGVPASILPPTPGAIGSGLIQRFSTKGSASSKNEAFFFQDSWQPVPRLSLNLGIRTEREEAPSFTPGQPSVKFNFADKIAPRLGAAFDLTGDGRTKLFASYGRFYDRFKYELPRGSFGGDFFRNDYFEIFPGDGPFTNFTARSIIGSNPDPIGGTCPILNSSGRSRCQLDFRIPSNAPGANILESGGIDPDIEPFRQSEFTVGAERDLGRGLLLSGRYTHKKVDVAVEDIGFSSPQGSEAFIIGNPGRGLAAQVARDFGFIPLEAERKYDAVEVRLDKRFTKRYYFNANYTYSRLFGNYSGLASSDEDGRTSPNVNRNFDLPFVGFTALGQPDNGRLPTDRPHVFKFYGAYTLDYNDQFGLGAGNSTEFSVFTTGQSGTPLTTRFTFFRVDNTILNGRGDLGRTEKFTQTDLGIRHKYRFGSNERLQMVFDVDILNAFNESNVLAVFDNISGINFSGADIGLSSNTATAEAQFQRQPTRDAIMAAINASAAGVDPRFKQPTTFQGGRSVRFGFRFLF